jgi:Bacterial Ig-like domain (group 2)
MKARLQIFFMVLAFSGCIGTDYLEDPIVGERMEVTPLQVALMPGQTTQLTARYFDIYGVEQEVTIVWTSSVPDVAIVDEDGVVMASKAGQTVVTASYQTAVSEAININVVLDENAVALVEVSAVKTELEVGEETTLTAVVKNIEGTILEGRPLEWFSENASIVTVNADGKAAAIANGLAGVHAKSEGVKSNSVNFVVGSARSGNFVPAGGYNAEGMAVLRLDEAGKVILELSDDFKTSFALGTYIYLSNTTSGSSTFSNGLEVAQIFANGTKSFNVTDVSPTVALFDYRYVIILCKPARVTFGYADLN